MNRLDRLAIVRGSWEVCADAENEYWYAGRTIGHATGKKRICDVADCYLDEERTAIASLIAAAPELYEALQAMFDEYPGNGGRMNARQSAASDLARAALQKARG